MGENIGVKKIIGYSALKIKITKNKETINQIMTDTLLPFMYNSNNMSNGNNSSNNNNYLPRGSSCNLPSKNV